MKKVFRGTLLSRFLAISVLMIFLLSNIVSASLLDVIKNKGNNLITGAAEGETAPAESSPPPAPEPAPEPSPEPAPSPEPSPAPEPSTSPSPEPAPSPEPSPDTQPSPEPSPPSETPTQPPTEPAPSPDTPPSPSPEPTPAPEEKKCPDVYCNCPNGCVIREGCLTGECLQIDQELIKEHEDDFREIDEQRRKDDFEKRKKEEYEKYQKRLGKERGGDRRGPSREGQDRRDDRGYDEHRGPSEQDMKRMREENNRRMQEDQEMMKEGNEMRSEGMQNWLENLEFNLEDIEAQGVDVSEGRKYLEDAKNLLRKASSASDSREADKLFREAEKMLRGFQKLEMKLRQESDKLRMLEEVENVLDEIEGFLSFIEADIEEAKDLGADTTEADKLIAEINDAKSNLEKMRSTKDFDRRQFMKYMNVLRRFHPKFEKIMRELRAVVEVRRIVEEIDMHIEDSEDALANFKEAGIDVKEAEELLATAKANLQKVIELYKAGKAQQAFTILRKMEPLGRKMEKLMRGYGKQMDSSGRSGDFGKGQIEDILEEAFTRIPLAEGKIKEFSDDGIDTSDAEEILGKIKGIMFKAKELYKDGENEDALDVARQAFPYANKLEKLFREYRKKNLGIEEFAKLELVQSASTDEFASGEGDSGEATEEGSLLETSKVSALKNTVQKIRAEVKSLINAADTNIPGAESKLTEFKASGVDVRKAEELVAQIKKLVSAAKDKFEANDFIAALETLEKAYPLADKLESEFGKLGKKHTKDYLKAEVEAVLLKAKDRLPGVRESLKEYKAESLDTSKADELVNAIEKLIGDAEDKFNSGEYKAALDVLQRAFPLGSEVERLFDDYNKNRKDESKIKTQLDEIYKEVDTNLPVVEKTLSDLASKGSDVEKAKSLLAELKKIIATSQSLYQSKKYKEALIVVKKAESSEVELSQLINTYLAELETGKKEKVGKEDQAQEDESFLEKIGIGKKENDKFDQFDEDFRKHADDVEIKLPEKNRFEDEEDREDEFDDDRDERFDDREFEDERFSGRDFDRGGDFGDRDERFDDREFDDRRGPGIEREFRDDFGDREHVLKEEERSGKEHERVYTDKEIIKRDGSDALKREDKVRSRMEQPREFDEKRFEDEKYKKIEQQTRNQIGKEEYDRISSDRKTSEFNRQYDQDYERIKQEKMKEFESGSRPEDFGHSGEAPFTVPR